MSVRRSLGMTTIAQLVSFVLGFVSVVVVSRLLTPAEIGIYSVSVSVLGLAHVFREFGVGAFLIQVKKLDKRRFRAAFSVALMTSWSVAAILILARTPLASFYGHEGVAEVLTLLALNFFIMPFGTPLLAVMRRELQFGRLAVVTICSIVAQTAVTIGAAFAGEGYLSMAWGAIAQHVVKVTVLNIMRPGEVFIFPGISGFREVLGFGALSSSAAVIRSLGESAPSLVFGRTLGFADVAFYSRALGLKKMSIDRLQKIARSVYFPTFAKEIRNGGDAPYLYCQSMTYLFAIVGPSLALLALLSEPLILLVFGDQWVRSAPLATLICLYSLVTAPYLLMHSSLTAVGKIGMVVRVQTAVQMVRVGVLLTSIVYSLEQVVVLLGISFVAQAIISQLALKAAIGLRFRQLIFELRGSLILIPMTLTGPIVVIAVRSLNGWGENYHFVILALCGILAAAGWLLGVFLTNHVMKAEILHIYHKLCNR